MTFVEALAAENDRLAGEGEKVRRGEQSIPYQFCSYRSRGLYAEQLERWFEAVGAERVRVVESEALYRDPAVASELLAWLGLPDAPTPFRTLKRLPGRPQRTRKPCGTCGSGTDRTTRRLFGAPRSNLVGGRLVASLTHSVDVSAVKFVHTRSDSVRRVPAPSVDGAASPETASGVTAVVLTHRRPRLAGNVVRSLLTEERISPERVIVVVSGEGGLDDGALEESVRMVRLTSNVGPAGGFRTGLEVAFADASTQWAYLCEDDVGLFDLPTPRVASVLAGLRKFEDGAPGTTGAVVAYGRRFTGRGHSVNVVPGPEDPPFVPVDVAAWGATLISRRVLDRGVLPDTEWFFGYEDFDFFCRVRAAGLNVLHDRDAARAVAHDQTNAGRTAALAAARPVDSDEPWRAYYVARNFFHLARAHGSVSWQAWHLAYSARRMQLAGSNAERRATVHGLVDGVRGRRGAHPRYARSNGRVLSEVGKGRATLISRPRGGSGGQRPCSS